MMKEGDFVFGLSAGSQFLRSELLAGFTRAKIAQNATDQSKRERNLRESRKAYDAVLHFLPQTPLSHEEKEQFGSKLAELKFALRSLGEEV